MPTNTLVEICLYSKLPAQTGRPVKVAEQQIALFKVTSGEIYALENRSPHPKGGVLSEGLVSGHFVFCPVYDWKISLIDGKVQAPDQGQVKTYEVKIEDDKIFIVV